MIASAIPGIAKGIGSLFGGRKRRRRERRARKDLRNQMDAFRNFQFDNPYEDLENTFAGLENQFEDLQVATGAAEFQAQQQQQGLAQTLDALRGAGGGTGAAAIAQALAQSQARGSQQIAANLEQQERQNQMAAAQAATNLQSQQAQAGMRLEQQERQNQLAQAQAATNLQTQQAQAGMRLQQLEAAGADAMQQREFDRQSTLLGMAQQELAGARQARAQATADLGGTLGSIGTLGIGAGLGAFGEGPQNFIGGLFGKKNN